MAKFNFSSVESFTTVAAGNYPVTIASVETKAAADGADVWSVRFVIEDPSSDHNGASVFENIKLAPKSLFRLKMLLIGVGYSEAELSSEDFDIEPDDLVGLSAVIRVVQREYNGNTYANVKDYPVVTKNFTADNLVEKLEAHANRAIPEPIADNFTAPMAEVESVNDTTEIPLMTPTATTATAEAPKPTAAALQLMSALDLKSEEVPSSNGKTITKTDVTNYIAAQ